MKGKYLIRVAAEGLLIFFLFAACSEKEITIEVPADYQNWSRTVQEYLNYSIPGHLDKARVIYISDTGTQVQVAGTAGKSRWDYPEGTMIVKEAYEGLTIEPGELPIALTVMYKDPEHPKARGGWVWITKDPDSGTTSIVGSDFCFFCHTSANEGHPYGDKNPSGEFRDYVYFPFRKSSNP